jgi:hypothetical protein
VREIDGLRTAESQAHWSHMLIAPARATLGANVRELGNDREFIANVA